MLYRLVRPLKRKGTSNSSFQKRIPADVRQGMIGLSLLVPIGAERVRCDITEKMTTIRLSLRASSPAEVKVRQAELAAYFETLWESLRTSKAIRLTHRQCVALAGDFYRSWADSERGRTITVVSETMQPDTAWRVVEDPHVPSEAWQAALDHLSDFGDDAEPGELEPTFGPLIDHCLRARGISAVDAPSRSMLLREFLRALRDAFAVQKRQASGDYTPAAEQHRFPEWQSPKPEPAAGPIRGAEAATASADAVSLTGLVDRWWAEAKSAGRSRSTYESYRATINRFAAFLGHDNAKAVTNADVVRFKDHRLENGASIKTVKDSDMVGLKAVFGFAVANLLLPSNPADGIKLLRIKRVLMRPQGFTPDEAKAILTKAFGHCRSPKEKPQTAAAKRWVPWLCAYTGARVGEMVQLRKQDVTQIDGLWTITITPEAGTVKDKEVRRVVLHPHLVEQGFPQFVASANTDRLFLAAQPGEDIAGKWQATKNRLAEFAREVVSDERVKPNHGWRHLFQTRGREAGIEDSVLDAIGGWAPGSVARRYGEVSLQAQAAAFAKFPRFMVEVPPDA